MSIEEWESLITVALQDQGKRYSSQLRGLMLAEANPLSIEPWRSSALEVTNAMIRQFWRRATKRETFGSIDRVERKFGKPLETVYAVQSGPFLDVAYAYWTYHVEVGDLFPKHSNKWITHALKAVEINVRDVFFPTPGPLNIPMAARRSAQEQILRRFAPEIDVDRFLRENPILATR